MGAVKEYLLMRRQQGYESGTRIEIADGRSLTWDDIEQMSDGQVGTFALACPYCSPAHSTSTRFRLERETIGRARWHCFYCGVSGSLASGEPIDPAREAIARQEAARRKAAEQAEKTAKALKLWDQAVPVAGTPVIGYLHARAIHDLPPQVDSVLRFHPMCPLGSEGYRPCMVALMRDVHTNEPRALHRTWVSRSGRALGRMALGPIARAAVKLWPADAGNLVVGEGIETTLAAALYVRRNDGETCQPAWALTVANNLKYLPVLRSFSHLVILADNDASGTGERAADMCADRWLKTGRLVVKLMPKATGTDFNDVVRARAAVEH